MNSLLLKVLIITCLILQYGCAIKFKRKTPQTADKPVEVIQFEKLSAKAKNVDEKDKVKSPDKFTERDSQLITSYYLDKSNQVIRQDMIAHTKLSPKQEDKLVVNEYIPRDVQVIPLPLKL